MLRYVRLYCAFVSTATFPRPPPRLPCFPTGKKLYAPPPCLPPPKPSIPVGQSPTPRYGAHPAEIRAPLSVSPLLSPLYRHDSSLKRGAGASAPCRALPNDRDRAQGTSVRPCSIPFHKPSLLSPVLVFLWPLFGFTASIAGNIPQTHRSLAQWTSLVGLWGCCGAEGRQNVCLTVDWVLRRRHHHPPRRWRALNSTGVVTCSQMWALVLRNGYSVAPRSCRT